MFVIEAEADRMQEVVPLGEGEDGAAADRFSTPNAVQTADRCNIAVLFCPLHHQAQAIDAWNRNQVIAGIDAAIFGSFRRPLHTGADGVAQLPEVGITDRSVKTPGGGVLTVTVVEFQASVQRKSVFDVQIDIHFSGLGARVQCWSDSAIPKPVEREEVPGDLVEVHHPAFCQRRRGSLDRARQKIARSFNPQPPHHSFGDFQAGQSPAVTA